MSGGAWARRLVRWASRLAPSDERARFLEEWRAELHALEHPPGDGVAPPPALRFARGAFAHAVWLRWSRWRPEVALDDLRFAVRSLGRSPGFAAVAVTTLALGIATAGTLATLVYALVARPLPGVEAGDRLVQIGRVAEGQGPWGAFSWLSAGQVMDDPEGLFEGVGGFSLHQFRLGSGADADVVLGHFVTGSWFDVLGTRPAAGRLIQPDDDRIVGGHPVVVLGHGYWMRRWGGDPGVVGRTVAVDGVPYEVVGVAPEGYVGVRSTGLRPEVFVPAVMNPGYGGDLPFGSWRWSWLDLVGRVAGEVDRARLDEAEARLTDRLAAADESNAATRVVLQAGVGIDPWSRESIGNLTRMLGSLVALLVVLTAASVAHLALARASGRRAEFGVRGALGAGRRRLTRQLAFESLALSATATLLAVPGLLVLVRAVPEVLPFDLLASLRPDPRVWWMMTLMGLVSAAIAGAGPAWLAVRASRRGPAPAAGTERETPARLRTGLVVTQLAVSLGLVAGAGLLARSIERGAAADPGFESGTLRAAFLRLSFGEWDASSSVPLVREATRRLEALPGVASVAVGTQLPVAGGQSMGSASPEDRPDDELQVELTAVGPGYFETLGIEILEGRAPGDFGTEAEPVVVISRGLAERFWPGASAVGRRLGGDPSRRVVGVVDDVQFRTLRAPPNPAVYVPFEQGWQPGLAFAVSTVPGGAPSLAAIEEAVEAAAPGLEARAVDVRSAVLATLDDARRVGGVVGGFAALALLLATVGLFGVVSTAVQRRTREFGIRIALGARPDTVVALTLRSAGRLASVGLGVGLVVAVLVGRSLESVLFRVSPLDPTALVSAAAVLVLATALAAWLPARRAARLDPVESLRTE